jgi:hypothetical protein
MRARRRIMGWTAAPVALAAVLVGMLGSCVRVTPKVVRIGFVAPFEGRYREIGSDVIPAARLAIREWAAASANDRAGLAFELVAYDDMGDPALAAAQAEKLAADPDVAAVIGHWRDETTLAAAPIYAEAGLPLVTFTTTDVISGGEVTNLAPSAEALSAAAEAWAQAEGINAAVQIEPLAEVDKAVAAARQAGADDQAAIGGPVWGLGQFGALGGEWVEGLYYVSGAAAPGMADDAFLPPGGLDGFAAGYEEGSLGTPPGPLAEAAYYATWLAMEQIAGAGHPIIAGINLPEPTLDAEGRRTDAPIILYRWEDGARMPIARLE